MSRRPSSPSDDRQVAGRHAAARVPDGDTEVLARGRCSARGVAGSMVDAEIPVLSSVSPAGEVAAAVFAALEAGMSPTAIVAEFGIEPQAVESLFKQWCRLKQLELLSPSLPEAIDALRSTVERLVEAHAHARREERIWRARVEALPDAVERPANASARSDENPRQADSRPDWVCPCGRRNTLAAQLECGSCHRRSRWGWRLDGEVR